MATRTGAHFLRRALLLQDGAGLTDGQLLSHYIERQDEAAFEALVRRHGHMVLGVCRRVLHDHHDSENAFQATFLVLARKAASLASREPLAPWLHGVAHKTALKAKAAAARRRVREQLVPVLPEPGVPPPDPGWELRLLLDQELSRLPAKYRAPLILCDLEAKTYREAARHLGWPPGTLAVRLARAMQLLARRLSRRGVAVSVGPLAALLSPGGASAGVPSSLAAATARAASRPALEAVTTGLISSEVAALTEGVIRTMCPMKLQIAVVLLVAGLLGTALGAKAVKGLEAAAGPQVVEPKADLHKMQGEGGVVCLTANGEEGDAIGPPTRQAEPTSPKDDTTKSPRPAGDTPKPEGGTSHLQITVQGGRVLIRVTSKDQSFDAEADRVSFDDAKGLLVLEATGTGCVVLRRQPGGDVRARCSKLLLSLRTGQFDLVGRVQEP